MDTNTIRPPREADKEIMMVTSGGGVSAAHHQAVTLGGGRTKKKEQEQRTQQRQQNVDIIMYPHSNNPQQGQEELNATCHHHHSKCRISKLMVDPRNEDNDNDSFFLVKEEEEEAEEWRDSDNVTVQEIRQRVLVSTAMSADRENKSNDTTNNINMERHQATVLLGSGGGSSLSNNKNNSKGNNMACIHPPILLGSGGGGGSRSRRRPEEVIINSGEISPSQPLPPSQSEREDNDTAIDINSGFAVAQQQQQQSYFFKEENPTRDIPMIDKTTTTIITTLSNRNYVDCQKLKKGEEGALLLRFLNYANDNKPIQLTEYSTARRRPRGRRQRRYNNLPYNSILLLLLSILLPTNNNNNNLFVQATVSCRVDEECVDLLRPGSECIDGLCTNPFQQGCLRSYLGDDAFPYYRTCNSEDFLAAQKHNTTTLQELDVCDPSPLGYSEIRILSQNWESAMFTTWILQITLSELFQVPATIESSGPGRQLNFYDPQMSFSYGAMGYDLEALQRANDIVGGGSCPLEWRLEPPSPSPEGEEEDDNNNGFVYQSCAHTVTEVWSGQATTVANMTSLGIIEPAEGTGVVGKLGWFIPKFLAQQDPSLAHWLGLTGESNRRRVAETFKVPTTFGMFCREIVPHNCSVPTIFASRPPLDDNEASKYFVAGGVFNGYFRFTEQNDCDLNPTTCVGHVTDVPCEWTTFVVPQSYHLDLPVQSHGPVPPNSAYSYGQLLDIWAAANATKSAILLYWWYPDPTYQFYLGTDAEMQGVQLPPPRQECVTNRVTPAERCSDDEADRLGTELGSCDAEPHSLQKLVIANLFHYLNGRVPEDDNETQTKTITTTTTMSIKSSSDKQNPAFRSPAYDAIQALSITELQLGDIADAWENKGLDKWNYDPREAVCEWVVDNLETLQTWIPRTYPRKVVEEAYNDGHKVFYGFAVGVGVVVSLVVCGTAVLTFLWRNRPLLVFAQVNFLYFLLFGLELVAVGSVLVALEPRDATCVLQNWFIMLGYTLELVPLIVKVGAIHRMMRAAKKMKRITLNQRQLYMTVFFFVLLAGIVLTVWTAVDPSQRNSEVKLHPTRQTDRGETIVTVTQFCSSEKFDDAWRYLSLCWQVVLLLCATVLAFQTRNIRQDLNESHTLGVMIYSHFVFVVLRVITFLLASAIEDENGETTLDRNTLEAIRSLLLSLDVLVATSVYFGPKMYGLTKYDDDYFRAMMAFQRRQSVHRSSVHRSSFRGALPSSTNTGAGVLPPYSMMNSSYSQVGGYDPVLTASGSQLRGLQSSGDVRSSDNGRSSDRNSTFSSAASEGARKRRSSSKINFAIGEAILCEEKDIEGDIECNPKPSKESVPAGKLSDNPEDLKARTEVASAIVADAVAAPPMCNPSDDKSFYDDDSIGLEEIKDEPAMEAHPEDSIPQEEIEHALSALANLREEVKARNVEAEVAACHSGESLTKEMILDFQARSLEADVLARKERRKTEKSLTEEMIIDHIGRSSRTSPSQSKRRKKNNRTSASSRASSQYSRTSSQDDSEAPSESSSNMNSSFASFGLHSRLLRGRVSDPERAPAGNTSSIISSSIAEDEAKQDMDDKPNKEGMDMKTKAEIEEKTIKEESGELTTAEESDENPKKDELGKMQSIEDLDFEQFEKLCKDDKTLGSKHFFV